MPRQTLTQPNNRSRDNPKFGILRFIRRHFSTLFAFIYYFGVLWAIQSQPVVAKIEEKQWLPQWLLVTSNPSDYIIRWQQKRIQPDTIFHSAVATLGYIWRIRKTALLDLVNYSSRTTILQLIRQLQLLSWVLFIPWIGQFMTHWLKSMVELALFLKHINVNEAENVYPKMLLMMGYLIVLAWLASEVVVLANIGYYIMKVVQKNMIPTMNRRHVNRNRRNILGRN